MILLKEIREQKKLSQYQLASLSGVPQQTISAIESQKRQNPGVETLYPIAKALGCTVDDLYKCEEKEPIITRGNAYDYDG